MSLPALKRVRSTDDVLRQLQDASDIIFKALASKQIIDGLFLKDILVSSTGTTIDHRLGRPLQGWVLAGKDAEQDVWELPTTTPSSTLVLRSSSDDVTINLWVF